MRIGPGLGGFPARLPLATIEVALFRFFWGGEGGKSLDSVTHYSWNAIFFSGLYLGRGFCSSGLRFLPPFFFSKSFFFGWDMSSKIPPCTNFKYFFSLPKGFPVRVEGVKPRTLQGKKWCIQSYRIVCRMVTCRTPDST